MPDLPELPAFYMKGIILAAGKGTRLYPITRPVCKPLLPVYDKPMIFYPLAVLMQARIRDILIIVPPDTQEPFEKLLGDGSALGLHISYREQKVQRGIADAFLVGEDFIGDDSVCLILSDNVFYGERLHDYLMCARQNTSGATVFGYYVDNPRAFGVVEFDADGNARSIEEKPERPKSNYIVPGLYFYDNRVVEIAKHVRPSERGELEITAVNNVYLEKNELKVVTLGRDFVWLDAGNCDSLLASGLAVKKIQDETGRYVACLEELAYEHRYITREQLRAIGESLKMTHYGQYILKL